MSKQADDEGHLPEKRLSLSSEEQILRDFLEVQKQRINLDSRRADVLEKALEVADAQDKRKFEYASTTRDGNIALEKEKMKRMSVVVFAVLGLASVVVFAVLGFFLLGNEAQRAAAATLGTPAFIAIAGYGVLTTLVTAVKGLIGR